MDKDEFKVRTKEAARDLRDRRTERVRDVSDQKVDALKDRIHQLSREH